MHLYDRLYKTYGQWRRPDPRIAAHIDRALAGATSVVNVGAGLGSYEPTDRLVVAVEPSAAMVAQRPPTAAPAARATAIALPFRAAAFDAALAILTLHHWSDWRIGVAELVRVARERIVIFTWDPAAKGFWLVRDYFPEIMAIDRRAFPMPAAIAATIGAANVIPVPIPWGCTDGFLGAYWRRPSAYLDPGVRGTISSFAKIAGADQGLARLERDLADGTWLARNGHLLERDELDVGYRLVVGRGQVR